MLIFQFTLPREERRQVQAQPLTLQNFNPRSHERSDHITQSFVFRFFNFNPRSHERSDHFQRTLWRLLCHISIHAPTRGATSPGTTPLRWHWFQYTLPREERHITPEQWEQLKNFNTRSHERSDYDIRRDRHGGYISIHAPTRGATKVACYLATLIKFQSTLPREERQYPKSNICSYQKISIHAPTRGATLMAWWCLMIRWFQSTLPREERPFSATIEGLFLDFNPRSHERSDWVFPVIYLSI